MALRDVNAVVTITTNAVKAIDDGKKLKQIYADINEQLNKMRAEGKTDTSEFKQMQKLAEDTKAKINEMLRGMELIDKVMGDISGHIGKDLNRALRETSKEFNKTSSSTDEGKAKLEKLRDVVADLKRELSDRKGLTMSLKDAEAQLKNLNNASLDKLRQGLAAVREEAAKTADPMRRREYSRYADRYAAEIAIKEHGGIAGAPATGSLASEDRLRVEAERQRLVTAYQAASRSDDAAHKTWAAQALKEIQQYNSALQALTETERKDAQMKAEQKKAADALAAATKTSDAIARNQKVTIQELAEAQKYYETELKKLEGLNLSPQDQQQVDAMKAKLDAVNATLQDISRADIDKVLSDIDSQSLETLEATLKKLKEDAATFKIGDDREIKDAVSDMTALEQAISRFKDKLAGIDQLDFDHLENVPTEKLEAALKRIEEQEKSLKGTDEKLAQQMAENKTKVVNQLNKNKQATIDYANAEKVAAERGKHSVTEMQAAYDALQQKLLSLRAEEHDAIRQTRQQMRMLKSDINEVKGEVTGLTKLWKTAVRNIATYVGVFAGFNMVKSKIMEIAKDSLALSDSMAQVQKVTGLAAKEIDTLNYSLAKLDTRTTLTQLNDLAFSAGKMGLGKYGLEGVEGFVRATNQLQVALGDDLGNSVDEAITPLAKLAENLGLIQKMGVEKSMMAIGSSINELSQTTTAVGANIVDFARRIQPAAQMIGLTTDEILALGSASDAFGISSEISATSFTKFLAAYRTNTAEIERILGIAKGTLDQYFDQGRTIEGLMAIFQRMHDIGDLRYLEEAFKALGSEGSRMFTTFGAFSKNIDMFREHLATSTKAFQEATSVTREFNLVQETAQGLMERSSNIWRNAFVNPEGVDAMKQFAQAWYDVSKAMTGNKLVMGEIKFLLAGIVELVKILVYMLPSLLGGLTALAFGRGLVGIRNALELTKLSAAGLTLSLNGLTTAWKTLSAVGKANWFGLIATALLAAIEAFGMFNKKVQEAGIYLKDFKRDLSDLNIEYGKGEMELRRYRRAIDEANAGSKQRAAAIAQFNSKFKPYLSNLLTEKSTALDVAKAYQEVCKQMRAKMALELEEKDREKYVKPREQWTVQRREEYDALVKGTSRSQYGGEWLTGYLDDAKAGGKSWKQIAQDLNNSVFHVTQSSFDAVMKQLNSGEFNELVTKTVKMGSGKKTVQELMGPNAKQLWAAMRYVLQDLSTDNALQNVSKKYEPERKRINDYLASQDQQVEPVVIEPTQPDKGGSGTAKAPEWMVEEKKEAEKNTKAVIASIEEFYRLQEASANELAASGQLKGADFEMLVAHIQDRKDKMLLEARRAIVGDPNEFEKMRTELAQDIVKRDDKVSQAAMQRIQEAEPAKQGAVLRKYNGSDEVYGLDSNAHLNEIRKNAAQNELNIQRREAKLMQEIDKFLMQYQFIEQAQQDFGDRLVKLGLVSDGYAKVVKQLADGTQITANTAEVQQFANKVSGMGGKLYGVDTNNAQELARMTKYMMTDAEGNEEGFASIFPDYKEWLKQPELYKDKMVTLYEMMIQYEGIYYDAIKKRDDLQSKRLDSWWEHSDEKKQNDKTMRSIDKYGFQYNNFGENQGMGYMMGLTNDVNQDPEVLREKAILEAKMAIWEKAKEEREAGLISEEVYQEKLQQMQDATMNYTQAVMTNINKRIDRVKQFVKPVETAAKSIGQKLGAMISGMEEDEVTWEEIWKNMTLAVVESMLTMAGQYAQNAIIKASMNKSEEAEEGTHATIMTMLGISEAAAKTLGTLGWLGIALIPVITALLMGLLQSALSTKRSDTGANASAKKVKLASGMLTYDEGNVQTVVGDDGRVYRAREQRSLPEGVSMVTEPIATRVNGQQALVGERGPEIVIGRKTTRAIQMNRPDLLRDLALIDRGITTRKVRTFDEGNLSDLASAIRPTDASTESAANDGSQTIDAATAEALRQMPAAMAAFAQVMTVIQKQGIPAKIQKYGTGGLIDEVQSGLKFVSKYQ